MGFVLGGNGSLYYNTMEKDEMNFNLFCLSIIVPISIKQKLIIAELTGKYPSRLGKEYRIPLMIYPTGKGDKIWELQTYP